jgi:hypothetical protein
VCALSPFGYTPRMGSYIDSTDGLHHERGATLALNCPHCDVLAHLTPIAVPTHAELLAHRPKAVGCVFRCDACQSPIFLRFPIKNFGPQRIELGSQFQEVERRDERFTFTHLPEDVELYFREALGCYSNNLKQAFITMCRRTMQAAQARMTETGKLWLLDQLDDARKLADLDEATYSELRKVIAVTSISETQLPQLDELQCGALLEVMKDLLYQTFVRKGRLQQAMSMRRFFADESTQGLRIGNEV